MKTKLLPLALLCSWTFGSAAAEGPSFNCAKAEASVEKLICSDAALAALDRQMAAAYRAATAKASGPLAATLRAEQRGWVKGRNECWKARDQSTWVTATWTVQGVPACVAAQTQMRTAELQAVWRLLPPQTVQYACQGNPANEVVLNFFASDPATLRLERGDRTQTLWRVGAPGAAAADGRYEGQNIDLSLQGRAFQLNRLDTDTGKTETLACQAR